MDNIHGWSQNHEDTLSVGFCNRCGGEFCAKCLYVVKGRYGLKLYYCPECADKAMLTGSGLAACVGVSAVVFTLLGFAMFFAGLPEGIVVLGFGLFSVPYALYLHFHPRPLLTVYDQQHAQGQ